MCCLDVGLYVRKCVSGVPETALAAGHGALSMSINAENCREIYDGLQALGIKHNAKRSACLNQTHNPSSCLAPFLSPYFTSIANSL